MSRAIAPTNQWYEPTARGVVVRTARLYPILVNGHWGFTEDADIAMGTIVTIAGSNHVTIEAHVDPTARLAGRAGVPSWHSDGQRLLIIHVPVGTGVP